MARYFLIRGQMIQRNARSLFPYPVQYLHLGDPHVGLFAYRDDRPQVGTDRGPDFVLAGTDAALDASVVGLTPLTFQWQQDGINVPGGTNLTLVLHNVQLANAGEYTLTVRNARGVSVSAIAMLDISYLAAWGRNDTGQGTPPIGPSNWAVGGSC
jgi:hypothetical protein